MASDPPRSRRGRVIKNLKRQLETISIANGYANNVYKVTFDVHNWSDTPEAETPTLYIIDENTKYKYNPGRLTEREWYIGIYGVMKNKTQIDMEELIADIEECLYKNVTLSFDGEIPGPAAHMRIIDIITDNQLFSQIEGHQLFKVVLQLLYTTCINNPR